MKVFIVVELVDFNGYYAGDETKVFFKREDAVKYADALNDQYGEDDRFHVIEVEAE